MSLAGIENLHPLSGHAESAMHAVSVWSHFEPGELAVWSRTVRNGRTRQLVQKLGTVVETRMKVAQIDVLIEDKIQTFVCTDSTVHSTLTKLTEENEFHFQTCG